MDPPFPWGCRGQHHREEGVGEEREHDVAIPAVMLPDLVLGEPHLLLRRLEALLEMAQRVPATRTTSASVARAGAKTT